MRSTIDSSIANNAKRGFRPSNKLYRKVFSKSEKRSKAIDKFGNDYFYTSPEDETQSISITLPKSMIEEVNKYCAKNGITRSRLIRKIIEYSLNLKKVD